jgi:hypothetical protein
MQREKHWNRQGLSSKDSLRAAMKSGMRRMEAGYKLDRTERLFVLIRRQMDIVPESVPTATALTPTIQAKLCNHKE